MTLKFTNAILLILAIQAPPILAEGQEQGQEHGHSHGLEKKHYFTTIAITAPFALTTSPTTFTRDQTEHFSKKDNKIILQAKADALTFVATKGEHKGIYLETALTLLRKIIPTKQTTDLQLAQAIIIF